MKRMRGMLYTLAVLPLLAISACKSDSTAPSGEGTVVGKVTAADGTTPVPGANVFVEAKGPTDGATTSGVDGSYTLNAVPSGTQVIIAEKGNFKATKTVNVQAGQTTNAQATTLLAVGKLGYVAGAYDFIEDILQNLGYSPDALTASSMSSSTVTSQYKMIFLNCGSFIPTSAATNLKAWVNAGGTLYASDWEIDVTQAMFPSDILEVGSGDEQTITASITNTALQQFVGKSSVQIAYDLSDWKMLQSISSTPTVLLRGTVTGFDEVTFESQTFTNQPLAISISHGQGRVVYTTFHNEAGVTADQIVVLRHFIYF